MDPVPDAALRKETVALLTRVNDPKFNVVPVLGPAAELPEITKLPLAVTFPNVSLIATLPLDEVLYANRPPLNVIGTVPVRPVTAVVG
jgi:hypothetical protein